MVEVKKPYTLHQMSDSWVVEDSEGRKLKIDFDENKKDYARKHKGSGEPLAKALGFKDGIRHVLDMSAGLGIDSVFMAQIGFQVTSLERNSLIAFLLSEAQKLSKKDEIRNIQFLHQDAIDFLKTFKPQEPTSAYFDPMYPEKKKSALPRQEMVVFRNLVGGDADSQSVLKAALESPLHRIVVKRPVKAEALLEKPAYSLETKLVRYDVYYGRGKK